ncbi:UNVERIFIED_CONTAM: hypothetical protein GTU68_037216 [Idotea baltica]|nr:hypothetical protein [Idotea baltica]
MSSLVEMFEIDSTHKVVPSYGSTGKHYAQIINGAPFDLFLAADSVRPTLLERQGLVVYGSRYTYAVGKLVLWGSTSSSNDLNADSLLNDNVSYVSLANPRLAPYGRAAEQVIASLKLGDRLISKLVRGENVAQAFQFVDSGNAQLGFVAYSQVVDGPGQGVSWLIPQSLYDPIEQQAVMIEETTASKEFSENHVDAGYDVP